MSKYVVVGHSDKPSQPLQQQTKKSPTSDFLKNIIKANVTRTSTVQKSDLPPVVNGLKFESTQSDTKVSFAAITTNDKKTTTTTTTQTTISSTTPTIPKKSALKKTEYTIPIQKSALIDSYDGDSDGDNNKTQAQKVTKKVSTTISTPQPTKSTKASKSTPQPTPQPPSKPIDKKPTKPIEKAPTKKAMPGFFSAGSMPEFGSADNKFEKRKKSSKSTPTSQTTPKLQDTKRQKGNDSTPVKTVASNKAKPMFMAAGEVGEYSGDDDDSDDVDDSDEERMKSMFGGDDDDDSEPEFGVYGETDDDDDSEDEHKTISKRQPPTKAKITPQTKVQLGQGKKAVTMADDEEEMDGFMSDDEDDFPAPQKPATKSKKVEVKIEKKSDKKTLNKKQQVDEEEEMDGFMSDDDDDDIITSKNNDDSDDSDDSDDDDDDYEKEEEQKPKKSLQKSIKSEQVSIPSVTFTPQQLAAIPPSPTIPNNIIPFTNPLASNHTQPTHSIPITLYYPLESNNKKQQKTVNIDCYDINYFQNNLHSVLSYPYLNTLKESLFFMLQSEVNSRYLFEYLPSNFTPRHNLKSGPSTLHNSTNNHLLLILNEEMIRYQQASSLYGKFQRTFNALKDNSFNNYEQWVIRNLSISPKLLPHSLASFQNRQKLFDHMKARKVAPQSFVPPTIFDKFTLRTTASRLLQADRERDGDILFGSPNTTLADTELREQLKMRGTDDSRGSGGQQMSKKYSKEALSEVDLKMIKFSKALKLSIDEIKNVQNQLSSKGCHHKDTIIKVSEDINKNAMNQDITVLYKHIAQFDRVSITFHTGVGPITLSIPHTVKLVIMYISAMIVNNCLDDDILNKMMKLDHNSITSTLTTEQERVDNDYPILSEILNSALPYLESNFTPLQGATTGNSNDVDEDDSDMIEVDGEKFSIEQQEGDDNNTTLTASTSNQSPQLAPQLTKQVAHILTQFQFKLPPQSIIYQYISMILNGLHVTPKIPNLKNPTTQLPGFPQAIAQSIVSVLFRYDALHGGQQYQGGGKGNTSSSGTGGGNQAAVPPMFLQKCGELLNVNIEAFASPLNAYFNSYCSAFGDTDLPFGSLGSFFHFRPTSGSIFVNPPFAANTILASIIHAEQLLAVSEREQLYASQIVVEKRPVAATTTAPVGKKPLIKQQITSSNTVTTIKPLPSPLHTKLHEDKGLTFVFVFPYKDDELFTQWITSSPYCRFFAILPSRQHVYTIGRQETNITKKEFYRPARHDTILAILQNDKATKANKVTPEIIKSLLTNFLVHIPLRGAAAAAAKNNNHDNADDLMNIQAQPKDEEDNSHLFNPSLFGLAPDASDDNTD